MRTGYIRPNQDRLTPIAGRINIVLASVFLILAASCTTGSDPETLSPGTATGDGTTSIETAAPGPVSTLNPEMLPSFNTPGGTGGIYIKADLHTIIPDRPRLDILKYLVQEGDTLFGIAEKYGLKAESILWGNWYTLEQDPHTLKPGQELNVPPIDGVLYSWSEGDNISKVADSFHAEPEALIEWPGNHIAFDVDYANPEIEEGSLILIPGGRRDAPTWQMVTITRSNPAAASILGPGFCGSVSSGPIGTGVFDWPTSSRWISGYNYIPGVHEAIDIGGAIGHGIFASDNGVVVYSGWNNYGYGYVVVIDHGNGWQTLYAHLDTINVGCGQAVFKGGTIGTMGVTGNSSGPHLHFEMRSELWGRVNPHNFLP
jgi:murein DD-endopeptidase MepM/ murein hydrolase activator NlpD